MSVQKDRQTSEYAKRIREQICKFFHNARIEYFAALPLSECSIIKPYLLEKNRISMSGSALCFLVPYYTTEGKNISAYAVSEDYHLFFRDFFVSLTAFLSGIFPKYDFFGFSDHSPISEVHAAVTCGLGVVGDNRLLINEKYSSYVFIGEVISNLPAKRYMLPRQAPHMRHMPHISSNSANLAKSCEKCGKCIAACPSGALSGKGACISAITQKKGELSLSEQQLIIKSGSAWGCDICQTVCPHTKKAQDSGKIHTEIDFFWRERICELDTERVENMSEREFSQRAYSWRGRQTICRNLHILNSERLPTEE